MDNISEERLALVHPLTSQRVHNLCDALVTEGYTPRVTRGLSSIAEQNTLWQIGRDSNGNVIGNTVTNAKGTQSNHVMGWAADIAFMVNGQPDWKSVGFDRLVSLAPSYGLRSGAPWHDRPHVELEEVPTEPTSEVQQIYLDAGVEAVWEQVELG